MTDDLSITSGSVRDDASRRRALLIVRLLVGVFLVYLLLDLVRPRRQPDEPVLAVLRQLKLSDSLGQTLSIPPRLLAAVAVGIVTGLILQALAANARFAGGRRVVVLTWATMAAMLGPFALVSLVMLIVFGSSLPVVVACAASSAFVLWLLHHCQGFARLPVRMLLAAFGWGALIVFGLSRVYNAMALGVIDGYLGTPSELDMLVVHMGVVVGVVTVAGVLLSLIVFRHRVTDAVSGLVLGAAIGLGYNFTESVPLIQVYGLLSWVTGATGGFQYWIRQSIGLLGGHVTFCALLGAAVGLAVQTRGRGRRVLIVGAGLLAAAGGSAAHEILPAWFSQLARQSLPTGGPLDTLVVSPALWLVVQVPFFVLVLALLWTGVRARAAAAREAVAAEATVGGAITTREVPFLVDPALRLWAVVSTWRGYGRDAALALRRVQTAQLDLAAWHWQHRRSGRDEGASEGERLRAKVIRLKTRTATGPAVTP
ncbi:PrsW family glutamic-type intramembrane protease [Streptosporangium saharense]|uniref:PrsW family intramembrane metalloprotease n=1 Tax=Streptosporangium saharense TaxID=1706840 RepID=A0A7W7VP30_9ACTN|nr:PrsW family glutamic-type intramembrane protease [Streptosporangium saharense]MBB4917502.1 hypothetical protein [Streptosporangium saharense]